MSEVEVCGRCGDRLGSAPIAFAGLWLCASCGGGLVAAREELVASWRGRRSLALWIVGLGGLLLDAALAASLHRAGPPASLWDVRALVFVAELASLTLHLNLLSRKPWTRRAAALSPPAFVLLALLASLEREPPALVLLLLLSAALHALSWWRFDALRERVGFGEEVAVEELDRLVWRHEEE